jgi:hypothetical protein
MDRFGECKFGVPVQSLNGAWPQIAPAKPQPRESLLSRRVASQSEGGKSLPANDDEKINPPRSCISNLNSARRI